MKIITNSKSIGVLFLLSILACEPAPQQETKSAPNNEPADLKAWLDEHADRAETATEEEWNKMKAEFERRSADLENKSTGWDEATRQEWEQVRMRWNETEGKVQTRLRNNDVQSEADTIN